MIVNIEPGRMAVEPEVRNNAHEHLIYSFARGCAPWFVTLLMPVSRRYDPDTGDDPAGELGLELRTIHDGSDQVAARIVRVPAGERVIYIGCRRGRGGTPVEFVHGIRTDAMLLHVTEHPGGKLDISAVKATVVEHRGKEIAGAGEPADIHLDGIALGPDIVDP